MKEMVGGCCVCSDERGWPENPLVYCDGQNCTVAVHQACYGIVTVPTGPWYCRKCESQERSARVRCELCPSRDGALKKTDNEGWAHVVCALYIPEVRFGNVTTMEPIILQLIPPERYSKACYICQEIGKGGRANVGACMQCNKSGCKQQFHVTCAQALGLLCEEAGNYLDNVKYCGYCQHHYSKLKKGGNVKTIPPYKPITHEANSSDGISSPEKELESNISGTSMRTTIKINSNANVNTTIATTSSSSSSSASAALSKQRKSSSTSKIIGSSTAAVATTSSITSSNVMSGTSANILPSSSNSSSSKNSSSSSSSSKEKDKHSKSVGKVSSSSKNQEKESSSTRDKTKSSKNSKETSSDHGNLPSSTITSTNATAANSSSSSTSNSSSLGNSGKDSLGQKFTTSNFTETVVINSESVFNSNDHSGNTTSSSSKSSFSTSSSNKKRKSESGKISNTSSGNLENTELNKDIIKDVSVTLIPLPMEKSDTVDNDRASKKAKAELNTCSSLTSTNEPNLQNVSPNLMGHQPVSTISIKQPAVQQTPSVSLPQQSPSNHLTVQIKSGVLKEVAAEGRLRSSSPYNSTNVSLGGNTNVSTPSLYVSVPLPTTTVPGVNLPTNSSNVSDHLTQSQPSRASPIINHHSTHVVNSNILQTVVLERQSPRIHQSPSFSSSSANNSIELGSGSVLKTSPIITMPTSISPTAKSTTPGVSVAPGQTMESSSMKYPYDKHNLRISQLQEDQLPGRRSRSQSGDGSGKSRSGKKRSAANVVISTSTSSSSSSSSSGTSTMSARSAISAAVPALPIGSNTGGIGIVVGGCTNSPGTDAPICTDNDSNSKAKSTITVKNSLHRHNEMLNTQNTIVNSTNNNNNNNNNINNNNNHSNNNNSSSINNSNNSSNSNNININSNNTNDSATNNILVNNNSNTVHKTNLVIEMSMAHNLANPSISSMNAKQLNKKLLRAQQNQYSSQHQHQHQHQLHQQQQQQQLLQQQQHQQQHHQQQTQQHLHQQQQPQLHSHSQKQHTQSQLSLQSQKHDQSQSQQQSQSQSQSQQQHQQNHQQQQQFQSQSQTQIQSQSQIQTLPQTLPISNDENLQNSISSSNSRTPDAGSFALLSSSNNPSNTVNSSGAGSTGTGTVGVGSVSTSAGGVSVGSGSAGSGSSNGNGGLKFIFETQTGFNVQPISPPDVSSQPVVKDSPPSSPGSEAGSAKKRKRKSTDSKDFKFFQNGVHATHMLGNQLNPTSSVAQKMSDQLHMELEAHSVYIPPNMDSGPPLVGIPFPSKQISTKSSNNSNPISSLLSGNTSQTGNTSGNTSQSLKQLLERQWEQGSQFLMEQAQHFDIASLLSCLHQLQAENARLEDHISNLVSRRDHLLAVNARLAIPLGPNPLQNSNALASMQMMNGPTNDSTAQSSTPAPGRIPRANAHFNAQQPIPMENGVDFRHSSGHQSVPINQSTSRHSSANSNYSSSTSSSHSQHNLLASGRHSGLSGSGVSTNSQASETISRVRGNSGTSGSGNTVGGGGGGGGTGSSYHNATQQSAYSTVHQTQLRREENQGKPS